MESINQSLDSYNYDNKAVADIIMDNVQKVKFEGISVRLDLIAWILKYFLQGTVAFSSDTGDRMALTMVEQLVGTKYQIVGYYDMRTDNLTLNKNSSGGTRELSSALLG